MKTWFIYTSNELKAFKLLCPPAMGIVICHSNTYAPLFQQFWFLHGDKLISTLDPLFLLPTLLCTPTVTNRNSTTSSPSLTFRAQQMGGKREIHQDSHFSSSLPTGLSWAGSVSPLKESASVRWPSLPGCCVSRYFLSIIFENKLFKNLMAILNIVIRVRSELQSKTCLVGPGVLSHWKHICILEFSWNKNDIKISFGPRILKMSDASVRSL